MKRLLDVFDQRILGELRGDGRISHSDLAHKVNLSRNAVRKRVERLEKDGVIRGYTVIADEDQTVRRHCVKAVIFVHRTDRMRGSDVIRRIKSISEVTSCDVLSGEMDLLVRVEISHAERLRDIWQQISQMPGVEDTVTSMVLG